MQMVKKSEMGITTNALYKIPNTFFYQQRLIYNIHRTDSETPLCHILKASVPQFMHGYEVINTHNFHRSYSFSCCEECLFGGRSDEATGDH